MQALTSEFRPAHPAPLLDGGGFVHSRVLDCVPSPHVTLHDDHGVQFAHPPSTETKQKDTVVFVVPHSVNIQGGAVPT